MIKTLNKKSVKKATKPISKISNKSLRLSPSLKSVAERYKVECMEALFESKVYRSSKELIADSVNW